MYMYVYIYNYIYMYIYIHIYIYIRVYAYLRIHIEQGLLMSHPSCVVLCTCIGCVHT